MGEPPTLLFEGALKKEIDPVGFHEDAPGGPCRLSPAARRTSRVGTCEGAGFEIAAGWMARCATASEAERQAFDAWLAESPCHRCAWWQARYLWRLLGDALVDEDL